MLRLVQLQGFEGRRPGQLSGGQQQRVALARVLATRPKLVLLDEPLSALDAKLREELRLELKQILATVGSTTIVVTHDQDEAMSLADRIIVMNRGRIEQQGTPDEIYSQPRTPFVAAFVGRANWIHGRISGEVAGGYAPAGDGSRLEPCHPQACGNRRRAMERLHPARADDGRQDLRQSAGKAWRQSAARPGGRHRQHGRRAASHHRLRGRPHDGGRAQPRPVAGREGRPCLAAFSRRGLRRLAPRRGLNVKMYMISGTATSHDQCRGGGRWDPMSKLYGMARPLHWEQEWLCLAHH